MREGKRTAANRHSALRKCRNAVSAGVLSPISSAVGRNGAVGDKESARAGARNYPPSETNTTLAPLRGDTSSAPFGGTCLPAGRSAGLTGHRPVIQRRGPLKGKADGGVSFNTADHQGGRLTEACHSIPRTHQGGRLELLRPGHPSPCDLIRGKADACGREGDEDRMEVGSENTWKKEWNSCR